MCRLNAIRLEEKEAREKEMRNQIIEEAEEFKQAFYEKRKLTVETNKTSNREKEKVRLSYFKPQFETNLFYYLTGCFRHP